MYCIAFLRNRAQYDLLVPKVPSRTCANGLSRCQLQKEPCEPIVYCKELAHRRAPVRASKTHAPLTACLIPNRRPAFRASKSSHKILREISRRVSIQKILAANWSFPARTRPKMWIPLFRPKMWIPLFHMKMWIPLFSHQNVDSAFSQTENVDSAFSQTENVDSAFLQIKMWTSNNTKHSQNQFHNLIPHF